MHLARKMKPAQLGGVLLSAFLVTGCLDEPSPVGSGLIPPSDLVSIDSVTVVAHESFSRKATPRTFFVPAARSFAVGKTPSLESHTLIQFPSFHDSLAQSSAVSAELRLRSVYHIGDSLGSFSLVVRKPVMSWNRASFTYDSLLVAGFSVPTTTPAQNFGSIGDGQEIRVIIDTAVVNEWFRFGTTTPHYGILLGPTNSTVIKGFHNSLADSAAFAPQLTVLLRDAGSSTIDTLRTTGFTERFVAGRQDTTFLSNPALMFARAGAAYRGIAGFDVSVIPAKSSVHRAILEVTLDPTSSEFTAAVRDSLAGHYILNDGTFQELTPPTTSTVLNPVRLGEPSTVAGRKVYRFTVTEFVQSWLRGHGQRRIGIAAAGEASSIDQFVFFGAGAADPSLRPKLTILYSPTP